MAQKSNEKIKNILKKFQTRKRDAEKFAIIISAIETTKGERDRRKTKHRKKLLP
jgi:hypothetical protein